MKRGEADASLSFLIPPYCHNVTKLGLAQDVAYKERLNKNVA